MASHTGLAWWLDQIGRIPLLTPAEEIELGNAVQAWLNHPAGPDSCPPGLQRRGKRAKERFVRANLRLAVSYISKHCNRLAKQHSTDDLIQAANEGLITAVERFDPTRGYRFSTYAYWWIRQAVNRWVDHHSRTIAIPGSHSQHLSKLGAITRRLQRELGRDPSREELAAELGVSLKVFDQLLINAKPIGSLDLIVHEDGLELGDVIATSDLSLEDQEDQQARHRQAAELQQLIKTLSKRNQLVLTVAWSLDGIERSRSEQAKTLGIKPRELDAAVAELQAQLRGMAVQGELFTVPRVEPPHRPRKVRRIRIRVCPGQLSLPGLLLPSPYAWQTGRVEPGLLQPA